MNLFTIFFSPSFSVCECIINFVGRSVFSESREFAFEPVVWLEFFLVLYCDVSSKTIEFHGKMLSSQTTGLNRGNKLRVKAERSKLAELEKHCSSGQDSMHKFEYVIKKITISRNDQNMMNNQISNFLIKNQSLV